MRVLLLSGLILLIACGHRREEVPYANSMHLSPAYLASLDTVNYTTIQWQDTIRDFGTIKEGDSIRFIYKFSNTGDKPLLLMNVRTSCGCTVARFPQNALFPGEKGEILVVFNSNDHPGSVMKSVTVASNTRNNSQHILVFKGNVLPKKQKSANEKKYTGLSGNSGQCLYFVDAADEFLQARAGKSV